MSRTSIIIDTDPGVDDAIALLMAMVSPELEILGITTVAGNVTQELAYDNARRLVQLADQNIEVYKGCETPMVIPLETAAHIHGLGGLGNYQTENLPPQSCLHAVDFIIQQCMESLETPITICTLGPLTNLAMALVKCPEIRAGIKQVITMAGAFNIAGNFSPAAEFNIYVDPHAAYVVINAGLDLTMIPLDVTNKTNVPYMWLETLSSGTGKVYAAVEQMLAFGLRKGWKPKIHDACVIACLLKPELFTLRPHLVKVDHNSGPSIGNTLLYPKTETPNLTAAMEIDQHAFFQLLSDRFKAYESPR
ncbi:nucleoside hydrolase [Endozoicomonas sp. OPT23]|uniref:nucleoside hydrolase n=1 Tax=Endozoicomonas sp. OPT23 TaxID=2072845 RepID=UPI00129B4B83|nr:nucleoside hydrolase [Endozoicomonas sp. OPT23]MRI35458.1 nucleoside hydrolase [Endozoicomonas sp. OPT23]